MLDRGERLAALVLLAVLVVLPLFGCRWFPTIAPLLSGTTVCLSFCGEAGASVDAAVVDVDTDVALLLRVCIRCRCRRARCLMDIGFAFDAGAGAAEDAGAD